jgi:hypothetical protein
MDIELKVLLLAILKKQENETLTDILLSLEASKVFTLKQGKKYLKELKSERLICENELTLTGIAQAKRVEEEFKI